MMEGLRPFTTPFCGMLVKLIRQRADFENWGQNDQEAVLEFLLSP
ncbi:MAG TPA: hypothetical protein VG675_22700 [Bryobacteraceae bacterium]|nr:hypothetical protein [Bryobacteraceae bacterium]